MKIVKQSKCFAGRVNFCRHSSREIQAGMNFSVYVPDINSNRKLPVLFWLSGLTCTEENFMAKAGAQQWASKHGLMVVCPDTSPRGLGLPEEDKDWDFGSGAGFYVNATQEPWSMNYRMYDYVVDELYEMVPNNFPADMDRVSISGHSMGGHGALVIGLRNPGKFKSVSAFSPICAPMQCPWGKKAFLNYLGANKNDWKAYDASELIAVTEKKVPILIDQGTADEFMDSQLKTQILEQVCETSKYPAEIRIQEGYDHSYYFISTFIGDHIDFHMEHLR